MSILDRTKAGVSLSKLIVDAHPGFVEHLKIQRPRTRQTVIEMLNSALVTPDGSSLKKAMDENDPEIQKLIAAGYTDKANGVRSEASEFINAVRRTTVDIGMWAQPGWFQFFDFVRLADNERPQVQQDFENEFEIIQLGQEFGIEVKRYVKENMSFRDINMVFRSSREVVYTLINPNTGKYSLNKPTNDELERSHRYKLNELSGDAIQASLGAFPTALGEQSFLLHNQSLTHSAFKNVPTTNILNLTAEGSITKEVFIAIIDYTDRMPGLGEGQPGRRIRAIHVPSIDRAQLNRFVSVATPFSGAPEVSAQATFSPAFQAELESEGFKSTMFGVTFTLVVDKTLPADSLYVSFDQAAGTIWEKPGLTQVVDRVEMEKNRGLVKLLKVYQVTVEPHQRPNVLRINYK